MRKGTITSIVLALIVAASASASKNFFKREPTTTCDIVTCRSEGESCTDDKLQKCSVNFGCVDNVCVRYAEGVPCSDDGRCPYNDTLYCGPSDGLCHKFKEEMEECNEAYECKAGHFCNKTSRSELPGMCLPNPTNFGDFCYIDDNNVDNCPPETKCYNGTCLLYPSTPGFPCFSFVGCNNASLICDVFCKEAPKYDEACINSKCGPGLYCDETLSKCAYLPTAGEACHSSEPSCAPGLYCNSDLKCEALPTTGMPCGNGDECAYGLYCMDDQGVKTCAEYPDAGEECLDSKCRDGLVCDNGWCHNPVSQEGEICSDVVRCGSGLVCDRDEGTCVVGECYDYSECK